MSDVLVTVADGVGRIRLNRPRAINALSAAMLRLRPSAVRICSFWNSAAYQRNEKPPQTVARREPLNE